LHDLYIDTLLKKRKQLDHNACLLGEATVSEWMGKFYQIKSSPL